MKSFLVKDRDGDWRCSFCRSKQDKPMEFCKMCGQMFANWEEYLIEELQNHLRDEIELNGE